MEETWEPIGRTLQAVIDRCRELGAAPNPSWLGFSTKELGLALRVAEAKERLVCDELVRTLVKPGGAIGRPPQPQAYFCVLRGLCALDTLSILHAELRTRPLYNKPPDWPAEDLLEWLLISNWEQRHDTWLKLSAYAISTGNAFYSG